MYIYMYDPLRFQLRPADTPFLFVRSMQSTRLDGLSATENIVNRPCHVASVKGYGTKQSKSHLVSKRGGGVAEDPDDLENESDGHNC